MHILLIHQAFAALNEAGGTRHAELARCLVERGHTVTVIASSVSYLTGESASKRVHWSEKQTPFPGMTIIRTYTYPALHRSFVHRVFSFFSFMFSSFWVGLGVRNVDVVWGTSPPIFQGVTAWLLARLKRTPFLFEVRDLWPAFAIAVGVLRNPLLKRMSLWLESFLYRHADRVMVNSPGFIDHVRSRGARWIELIPNGADPAMFDPQTDGSEYRAAHGLDSSFIATYAGAHGLSNDLGIVLDAANLLRARSDIQFLLIGDGKEKSALQKKALEMNLQNVTFLPAVPKNEMNAVLAASNCCIAILKPLELYKTTYPNKVFDYMAAGKPVVLAIDGVIRAVVEESNAGIFAQPGSPEAMANAVQTLADHPQQTRQMGLSGRRAVEEKFNRSRLALNLALLLEEMRRSHG